MKKYYSLKNIHCADCARSLEETISTFNGVINAKINFVTEKFELEIVDELWDETFKKVQKLIKDFSKDVVMAELREQQKTTKTIDFKVKGISCPNCAKKIEEALKKLKEVQEASFNFIAGILTLVVCEEANEKSIARIVSLVKNIEPAVKLKLVKTAEEKNKFNIRGFCFGVGLILAVIVGLSSFNAITISQGLYWAILILSALLLGYSTYITALKLLLNKNINENLLVTISVFGAIIVGEHLEGLMVIALYTLGKFLEGLAVNKSRKDIKALMNIKPENATILTESGEINIRPEEVQIGDIIVVKPGEKLAVDGIVVGGSSYIDTQSLTGESLPEFKKVGDEIISGVTAIDGKLEIKATKVYSASTVNKILDLIEQASEKKSKTETFIAKFAKYYTMLVIGLAILTGVITGLVLNDFKEAFYRGLLFLVVSCPCAFAISVPLSYFSGIGNASKKGILIKGTNYLDLCSKVGVVAFDKTGTLTSGEFKITNIEVLEDAYTKEELLYIACIGEANSIHPVAKAIQKRMAGKTIPEPDSFKEVAGEGVYFEYDGTEYFVGKSDLGIGTSVIVKKGNITLGVINLEDKEKATSKASIQSLRAMDIKTVILSGDKEEIAQKTAGHLGVDEFKAELLPQDKFAYIEDHIKQNSGKIIYVGDGINDAPSLALSDVGVSMGLNGSPASIEASDVVLVDDDPSKIKDLIQVSKFTKKVVIQNIVFASTIKGLCLILGAVGLANMIMAVFADVGVTILAILNSLRVLKYGIKGNKKQIKNKKK